MTADSINAQFSKSRSLEPRHRLRNSREYWPDCVSASDVAQLGVSVDDWLHHHHIETHDVDMEL